MIFQDRQGSNLNRKKLRIVSQTADEIIVDVERADSPTQEGTPINASTMNQFQQEINTSNTNASNAVTVANSASSNASNAVTTANNAETKATTALSKAETAITTANQAKAKADYVEEQLADRGTTIKVNGVSQTEVNFTSEPQEQIDNKLNKDFSSFEGKTTLSDLDKFAILDSATSTNMKVLFQTIKSSILNTAYPVGAIYMSTNSTSPETLFGGTWNEIIDRFLLSSGTRSAGEMGGEEGHILTTREMPNHTHTQNAHSHSENEHTHEVYSAGSWSYNAVGIHYGSSTNSYGLAAVENTSNNSYQLYNGSGSQKIVKDATATINSSTAINNSTGGGQAHNNMPPYLVVYMWQRVS